MMQTITPESVADMLKEHSRYFHKGHTHMVDFRITQLKALKAALKRYEPQLMQALQTDLGKGNFEAYTSEIGFVQRSLTDTIRHLKGWAKPTRAGTPFYLWPATSRIYREPYGTVLIVGPFNYPVQLVIEPLIGAIAGGNCAVIKPSENTPHLAEAITALLGDTFPAEYVRVINGGREATSALINAPFDYLFFTGSVAVGKIVMEAAAKNLTPVTLELGGKSPAIVERTADLALAAQRIVWGKFLNAGQTCIAPDYVLVDAACKEALIAHMKSAIQAYYGSDPRQSPDYGRIVNARQWERLGGLIPRPEDKALLHGGSIDRDALYIEPTLLAVDGWDAPAMQDELFGPLLPVMAYTSLDDALERVQARPKPLALYLFTKDKAVERQVLTQVSFGGGCVNDTISHIANPNLPFGGVGHSGIGAYHGKYSFELFTHPKSVVKKLGRLDNGLTTPPYGNKLKLVRKVLR